MSLIHNLEIATSLTPAQATDVMTRAIQPDRHDQNSLRVSGMFGIAGSLGDYVSDLTYEYYGFRPTLNVTFEVYSREDEDFLNGMRMMMRAAMSILQHDSGDAVMLFNGERTMLQRINGQLLLNAAWDNWTAHAKLLPEVTLPYKLRSLASPALEEEVEPAIA